LRSVPKMHLGLKKGLCQ